MTLLVDGCLQRRCGLTFLRHASARPRGEAHPQVGACGMPRSLHGAQEKGTLRTQELPNMSTLLRGAGDVVSSYRYGLK